jgi:hypothetical protein
MIEQLSVFLENKTGRLAEMARALGDAGLSMRALVVADTAEFGVVRILVDRPSQAKEVLEAAGFGVQVTDVIAVAVPDRAGGLADVLETLGEAGVNIEYAYCFVPPDSETAVDVFRVEDGEAASRVLSAAGIRVLEASALYEGDTA